MATTHDPSLPPLSVDPLPLLQALPTASGILDARGALRSANQLMKSLIEESALPFVSPSSASGSPSLLASTPAMADVSAELQALLRGEREEVERELPSSASDAPRRALTATPCAVDGARGALVCVRDLPREDTTLPSTASLESFFDVILGHVPLAIFVKEAKEFRVVWLNRRYEEIYQVSRENLLGKNNYDLLPKKDADYIRRKDIEVITGRKVVDIPEEVINIPGRGEMIYHSCRIPLYDENGAPLYTVSIIEDITERKRAEEARRREIDWIETQERLLAVIHELSTPVIPVHEGILVVPLVGHLDAARSEQLTKTLLAGIQDHRAEVVILDITGVPVIDAGVVEHLIQATRAAALLGATCVLVGTAPDVARTMIELGIDLGCVATQRDLQAGIRYALARQGKGIVALPSSSSAERAQKQ